ncbi:hypothetical protein Cgig2_012970 [Carnegiea gigantea]|uniref:Uncharacterized protein n=1 Tax=Carnegiea gigantea TaxID=171969 RepID=A0A9Q1K195_9CARY|nr:hypothetical protein Cgig2_012970 [Carnegiea gigantea]
MKVYLEYVLEHMHAFWTNWKADLKSGLNKNKWEWLVKGIYSKDPNKKVSARNSTNRLYYKKDRVHRTGSKPYRVQRSEVSHLFFKCFVKLTKRASVETEMIKIKDLVFEQFNTRPSSITCDEHETPGSNLISIFILLFENWFRLNVGRYLDSVRFSCVMVK